jgi:hypothetical protein
LLLLEELRRLGDGLGEAYCLTAKECREISPGWYVIVLDRTNRRRAFRKLAAFEPLRPHAVETARACSKSENTLRRSL